MIESLSFDDVLLVPGHGTLDSRKDADLSTELVQGYPLNIPLISANMPSVTNSWVADIMWDFGGIGAMHRFYDCFPDQLGAYRSLSYDAIVSLGLDHTLDEIDDLCASGANLFLLDVAHADCKRVVDRIHDFRDWYGAEKYLIVGNVATSDGARRLASAGADAIKVGIGPGAACTTRTVTGFGVPQFSAILDVARVKVLFPGIRIIADGGCKNSGDIVKALAAGADTVMIGRLIAGCDEAPEPGVYYGNASAHQNGHRAPEGEYGEIEHTGPLADTLKSLAWGIRSGVSYSGGTSVKDLRNTNYVKVTPLAAHESGVRL